MDLTVINTTPTLYEEPQAHRIAESLNDPGDDWTYVAVQCGSRWWRVDIIDEDGNTVGSWNG